MEFLLRFRNAFFLIAVLLAQALALAVQVRTPERPGRSDAGSVRLIRRWSSAVVTPFERATHGLGLGVRNAWADYVDLRHVRRQNQELQQQLTRMRIDEAAISEDAAQGRRLQALLAFKEKYVGSTVAAQVIGASGSDLSHIVTIDKGANYGLKPDMAVITPDGIVGKLRDVFPTTSEVLEINDPSAGAGVFLSSMHIRAILHGSASGQTQIENLLPDSRIKPGEVVTTSGGDQIYPRGLPVGAVQSVGPDSDHPPYARIVVRPAADLNRLEEVLIITGVQADPTASDQQDLAAAETQHAADVSAERLPGIHDDATPANSSASPANPTQPVALPVPHPVPALHTDRYSSGATPPASELTPGAPITPQVGATQSTPAERDSSGTR